MFVKTHFVVAADSQTSTLKNQKQHTLHRTHIHTCAEVSIRQRLQDGVHGAHVEDQAQLRHTHGDETQQEDGAEDALHEGLIWKAKTEGEFWAGSHVPLIS